MAPENGALGAGFRPAPPQFVVPTVVVKRRLLGGVSAGPLSRAIPFRPIAPGPGRSATPSTAGFPVGGMQKTDARMPWCGALSLRLPAGIPFSVIWVAD